MIHNFKEATKYLQELIREPQQFVYDPKILLKNPEQILELLGRPDRKLKIIHVAGTSGKGSISWLTKEALVSQGFKVGLHLSPHLIDFRERFMINNNLISKVKFVKYLNEVYPVLESLRKSKYGKVSYFTAMFGIACHIFAQEKVDYAVLEVGLGGRYDSTNAVDPTNKVSIIGKIGMDHMDFLGNTVKEIAWQKAGIIKGASPVFFVNQSKEVADIFKKEAKISNSKIYQINPKKSIKNVHLSQLKTSFDLEFEDLKLKNIKLGMIGKYQSHNASLALTVLNYLSQRDNFSINIKSLRKNLSETSFPGRFEIKKYKNKKLILDGAHNEQKMDSFIKSLKELFQEQKFNFLVAFKKGKDYKTMLDIIIPHAEKIFITEFLSEGNDLITKSEMPKDIGDYLFSKNFKSYEINPRFKNVIDKPKSYKNNLLVVTGSLYFLGDIYKYLK